eukprot:4670569-Karenia_brevis.AAC.1
MHQGHPVSCLCPCHQWPHLAHILQLLQQLAHPTHHAEKNPHHSVFTPFWGSSDALEADDWHNTYSQPRYVRMQMQQDSTTPMCYH